MASATVSTCKSRLDRTKRYLSRLKVDERQRCLPEDMIHRQADYLATLDVVREESGTYEKHLGDYEDAIARLPADGSQEFQELVVSVEDYQDFGYEMRRWMRDLKAEISKLKLEFEVRRVVEGGWERPQSSNPDVRSHVNEPVNPQARSASPASSVVIVCTAHSHASQIQTAGAQVAGGIASAGATQFNVKLPKLALTKFKGDPTKWKAFYDRFYNSVGRSTTLSKADKLSYLVSVLEDNPLSLVDGLDLKDENYDVALRVLIDAYGDPTIAIEDLESKLYRMQGPRNDSEQLRRFYCELESYLGSLAGLGCDVSSHHLVGLILSKLPYPVVTNLERAKTPTVQWTVELLRRHLKSEVEVREATDRRCGRQKWHEQNWREKKRIQVPHGTADAFAGQDRDKRRFRFKSGAAFTSKCAFCEGAGHDAEECTKYKTVAERMDRARERFLCFLCLSADHRARACQNSDSPCVYCRKAHHHHRSLCYAKYPKGTTFVRKENAHVGDGKDSVVPSGSRQDQNGSGRSETGHLADDEQTVLKTALVSVGRSREDATTEARMFLDSGCSRTYMTESLAKRLKLETQRSRSLIVNRFGGGNDGHHKIEIRTAQLAVKTIYGRTFWITVAVTSNIMNRMTKVAVKPDVLRKIPPDIQLADSPAGKTAEVDIDLLLGNDYYDDFVTGSRIVVSAGLRLISSEFGWLLSGRVADEDGKADEIVALYAQEVATVNVSDELVVEPTRDDVREVRIEDVWNLESIGITDNPNPAEDDTALEQFNKTVTFDGKRYQVAWPWKANADELPSNYAIARRRLETTVNRIKKTPGLIERYDAVIKDQIEKSVVEEAPEGGTTNRVHYLPHREVLTPQKETTKLRIVYDASAREAPDKPSLNDCLYRGLVFMTALICLLMRFMLSPVVVVSDIEKAFLQVGLQDQERDVTRFLWLRDLAKPATPDNIITYRFARVAFGMRPSPFLLGATIAHHLRQSLMEVARLIEDNIYVDNVITGFEGDEAALRFYHDAKNLFKLAGMNLREFASNSRKLMERIPEIDRAAKRSMKVLGLGWNIDTDELYLNVPEQFPRAETKRQAMQGLLKVYDPLGFVAPVTIRSRILLQQICRGKGRAWNDKLSQSEVEEYNSIVTEYAKIRTMRWPRYVGHVVDEKCRLMCFCDASKQAYATVVYLQRDDGKDVSTRIIFAKSRVSPLKGSVTIPRLELLAVLIGVRAIKFVREQLKFTGRVIVWSDSQCVLKWLGTDRVLGTFVENRLKEIRKVLGIEYRFVPTAENPADLPSRGTTVEGLTDFWFKGPGWCTKPETDWPNVHVDTKATSLTRDEEVGNCEHQKSDICMANVPFREPPFGINAERFSTFESLLRVTALCRLFVSLAQKKYDGARSHVRRNAMAVAEKMWIRHVQSIAFADLHKAIRVGKPHPLRNQLGTVVDQDGIVRCKGRLGAMRAPVDQAAPILMPSEGQVTKLLVEQYHRICLHSGSKHTLHSLRYRYWIIRGPSTVKGILRRCVICRRVDGIGFARPQMPDLPGCRVNREFPFSYTGLDYLGPVKVKNEVPGQEPVKAWVCLFTCLTVRALHLEIVGSLSAEDFLMALRRFFARRGKPRMILCDNASQFRKVQSFMKDPEVEWQFITPLSPWKGGIYERLVALVKSALKKSVGKALLKKDQLTTLLAEVEYTLNSRPLMKATDEVDHHVLSPNDLLGIRNVGDKAELSEDESTKDPTFGVKKDALAEMHRKTTNLLEQFWQIWQTDYLAELRERQRMLHKDAKGSVKREPKVGEVVVLKDARHPRNQWKLAVVTEVKPSADRAIRAVQLRLADGSKLVRPVTLIYPLEIDAAEPVTTTKSNTTKVIRSTRQAAIKARDKVKMLFDNDDA